MHILWPEYTWGQDRQSYFNLRNSLTPASWLAGMQFLAVAIFAIAAFFRDRSNAALRNQGSAAWIWLAGAVLCIFISFAEITRIHWRFNILGWPEPDIYAQMTAIPVLLILMTLFGIFLYGRTGHASSGKTAVIVCMAAFGVSAVTSPLAGAVQDEWKTWASLIQGISYLTGCTILMMLSGSYVLSRPEKTPAPCISPNHAFPGTASLPVLCGIFGISLIIIFLEILLFQLLTIFNGYLTANSIIAIALLGGAAGGLAGYFTANRFPFKTIITANLILPAGIILSLGTITAVRNMPLLTSFLLMVPFACAGTVLSVALVRMDSGLSYFSALLGAGTGAIVISPMFRFREEASMFFLAALALATSAFFIAAAEPRRKMRILYIVPVAITAGAIVFLGILNAQNDFLNVVREKVRRSYPEAEVLFSRSSFVGRYDVIRANREQKSLGTYENGRRIDTLRPYPASNHRIDPRIPHTFIKDPSVLILGLSGDAITKTSRYLGKEVFGVEINPVIADLQTHELLPYNARSYDGINWKVMDARSYVEQSKRQYDFITLLNTHFARGGTAECAPSPEYLFTAEALNSYLGHLTDRGAILVEEPITDDPAGEMPVLKLLFTMRQVLLDKGSSQPEDHFFVFQWKTGTNNYLQVLMKKTPLTDEDTASLVKWTEDVDDILEIEEKEGIRMGPIRATTTILHMPGKEFSTNVSRIVKNACGTDFLKAHNIRTITDNQPFMFDVTTSKPGLKKAYGRILVLILLIAPVFLWFIRRSGFSTAKLNLHLLAVASTGLGYMLIEMILIQRYEIFIGSPAATFAAVAGTILISSGLGTLWSRRVGIKGAYAGMGTIIILIVFQQYAVPHIFSATLELAPYAKTVLAAVLMAPLGFAMGIPFPFVMRMGKNDISDSSAAVLYTFNSITSALSVPLAFSISSELDIRAAFLAGLVIYVVVWLLIAGILERRLRKPAGLCATAVFALFLLFPYLPGLSGTLYKNNAGYNEVYAISYGKSKYDRSKVFAGGSDREYVKLEWMFWLIKAGNRNILVDTGFTDAETAKEEGIRNFVSPVERLKQAGVSPEDISDIIITHTHWDHIGALPSYKNARIWIQKKEYDYILKKSASGRKSTVTEYAKALFAAEKDGRLNIISGTAEPARGVVMYLAGGHTAGSQYVAVETIDGRIILAGDNIAVYDNNLFHIPVGSTHSRRDNRTAIAKMQAEGASPYLTIPGHDPDVMRFFPEVSEGIVRITTLSE